jgi:hypothetical protein
MTMHDRQKFADVLSSLKLDTALNMPTLLFLARFHEYVLDGSDAEYTDPSLLLDIEEFICRECCFPVSITPEMIQVRLLTERPRFRDEHSPILLARNSFGSEIGETPLDELKQRIASFRTLCETLERSQAAIEALPQRARETISADHAYDRIMAGRRLLALEAELQRRLTRKVFPLPLWTDEEGYVERAA